MGKGNTLGRPFPAHWLVGQRGAVPPPHLQAGPIVPAGPIVWGRSLIGRAPVCDCPLSALIGCMRRGLPGALGPQKFVPQLFPARSDRVPRLRRGGGPAQPG